ncbi:hypothetical protein AB0L22_09400 [Micromonospora haikouensis]|uniref:hypothetical protein n=1 Tax=Micromonospora haikouensis TaxID=686309 RepID=UPI0034122778
MHTPNIYRPLKPDRLRLWMPCQGGSNRSWLHATLGERIQPIYDKPTARWLIARNHFTLLVENLLDRFGQVDVFVEFSVTERCDSRCQGAEGDDCQCSCLGEYHGGGIWAGGWIQVGETTLVRSNVQLRHMQLTA